MSVLVIHGSGYQDDSSLRFLERQRLRTGLLAGFVAAKRLDAVTALHDDLASATFNVRFVEYSEALNEERLATEPPLPVEHHGQRAWGDQRKLRCICCPRNARVTTNIRTWTGGAGQSLQGATSTIIRRRLPDVHRYLTRENGRAETIQRVSDALRGGVDVAIAHSLGSIVAIDSLARVPDDESPKLLVTIGSPLRFNAVREQLDAATRDWIERRPVCWINVYDRGDVVTAGGGLPRSEYPGVINIRVNNGSHQHAGDFYLRHEIIGAIIWDVAAGKLAVDDLATGLPDVYKTTVKYSE